MSESGNKLGTHNKSATCSGHTVVGLRFKTSGKIYTFEIDDIDAEPGTWVVAESEMGLGLGCVIKPKHYIEKAEKPLKKVLRIASKKDMETDKNNRSFEAEAKAFCIDKVKSHNLPMKIVATETTLDRKRLIFYFTADGRIDFRELVRDLAAKFKTRIEMRQIGVRDEVKLIGGIGACGRETCCSLFLNSFEPVSIRMAKKQELVLNQSKLSGICGRLMCCLAYEYGELAEKTGDSEQQVRAHEAVTAGASDDSLQPGDSDAGLAYESQQAVVCSCQNTVCPAKKEETGLSQTERVIWGQKDISSEDRKKRKTIARGARALRSHDERKDKGKPFSRRKKFWKKKKR